jgi:DNA repair protein RadA/Sms
MRALAPYKAAFAHVLGRISWLGTPLQRSPPRDACAQRRPPRTWTQAATYASASVKKTVVYKCSECGEQSPQWRGRCPSCSGWNT